MSPYIRLNTLFLVSWIPQNTLIFLFGNICKKQAVIPICTRTISWLLVENIPAISLISSISLHFSVTSNLVAVTCKASRVTRYRNEKKGDPTISYCSLSTESYSYYSLVPISSNDNHNSIYKQHSNTRFAISQITEDQVAMEKVDATNFRSSKSL